MAMHGEDVSHEICEPDPAPPPRGLKQFSSIDLYQHGLVMGARPRPTSEGIETEVNFSSTRSIQVMESPTPPHLRGD